VIVDETSMVSLSQMARLLEAVRPQARLILVGDPGQLTSIEAGAVLGDIVGPADEAAPEERQPDDGPPGAGPPGAGIVLLSRVHRFGGAIGAVAEAVRRGDADAAVAALSSSDEVTWLPVDPETDAALAPVHDGAVGAARAVIEAAREGDAHRALNALAGFRVLCAHRRGPYGVETWTDRIERWLANEVEGFGAEGQWYVGRPLLVTENDYGLRLYNGDTGVVVATDSGRVSAAFERRGELIEFSPTRLGAVESVYAMTVHKSQGSQFAAAAVLLPDPTSQILTRELLYTAVTRARERLILVGTEEAVRAAVARPVARASGLRWRLWGNEGRP
jgi:exodeoxyribonuclease V alpha subunit